MLGEQEPAGGSGCSNQRVVGAIWRDGIARRDRKAFPLEARWDLASSVQSGELEEVQRRVTREGRYWEAP